MYRVPAGERRGRPVQPTTELGPWGEPSREPLICCRPLGGAWGQGGQREALGSRRLLRSTRIPEGSHGCARMPQSAFQNSTLQVRGGGSPLAHTLGTSCALCLGWHPVTPMGRSGPAHRPGGGRGNRASSQPGSPPHPLLASPPAMQTTDPQDPLLASPPAMWTRTKPVPSSTFLSPFKSRNTDWVAGWSVAGH